MVLYVHAKTRKIINALNVKDAQVVMGITYNDRRNNLSKYNELVDKDIVVPNHLKQYIGIAHSKYINRHTYLGKRPICMEEGCRKKAVYNNYCDAHKIIKPGYIRNVNRNPNITA